MARGGAGRGQGKKPLLTFNQRLGIYARYYELYSQYAETETKNRIEKVYDGVDLSGLLKTIHKVPLNLKRKRDGKSARTVVDELAASNRLIPEAYPFSGYPSVIVEAAEALRHRRNMTQELGAIFPAKRLFGTAAKLREQVAKEATEHFSIEITPSYIKWIIDDRRKEIQSYMEYIRPKDNDTINLDFD